jgi:hypothetical protein
MAETAETDGEIRGQLKACISAAAIEILGAPPDDVMLVPPQTVPKTASLKVRRGAARDLYISGQAPAAARGLYVQIIRLALTAVGPRLSQTMQLAGEWLYAGWWWRWPRACAGWPACCCRGLTGAGARSVRWRE